MQPLAQADSFQQPSAFSCNDWLNDETIFIHQAKLDQLGRNIYTADQNILAGFLFQFNYLVVKVRPNDSRISVFDAV